MERAAILKEIKERLHFLKANIAVDWGEEQWRDILVGEVEQLALLVEAAELASK